MTRIETDGQWTIEQQVAQRTAELRAQVESLRAVPDTIFSAIITIDVHGTIQSVNLAAQRMFGYSAAEMIGQNVTLLMPAPYRDEHGGYIRRFLETGQARVIGGSRELPARRKDGSIIHIDLAISPARQLNQFTGILYDITKRKNAEDALQRRLIELTILNRIGVICSEARSEDELLYGATAVIAESLYPDNCGFMLLDAARGVLVPHPSFVITDPKVVREDIRLDTGITGQVARTGLTLRAGDVSKEPSYLASDSRTRSELCIPMRIGGKVVGVANVESRLLNSFSETDEHLTTTIVDLVSNALERLRADEERRRNFNLLQAIIEGTTDAVFVKDLDGRYLLMNTAGTRVVGRAVAEVIGLDDASLFSAETARQIRADDRAITDSGVTRTFEEDTVAAGVARTFSSTKAPYRDGQGRVIGLIGIARDITEHKRADQALRESEHRLRSILDSEPECVQLLSADGAVLEMNPAGLAMFEADSPEQIVGRSVLPFVVPEDRAAFQALRQRAFQGESAVLEFAVIGLKGTHRWLEAHSSPLRSSDGTIIAMLSVMRDVSKRKELEREVVEIATLEQQRIGQDLHDDCGQELTALGLLADGLVESLQQSASEDIEIARKISQGVRRVLRQVRGIARGLARAKVAQTGLPAALSELTARLAETSGVRCTFDGPDGSGPGQDARGGNAAHQPELSAHEATHLYHIAQEACTNALKHAQAKNIDVRLHATRDSVLLEIQDDGLGIAQYAREGLGRRIMSDRASVIGARLAIEPATPRGTLVSCILARH